MQRSLAHLNDEIDDLQREYYAIAASRTSRSRVHGRCSFAKRATEDVFAIFESSPKKLLSALQIDDYPTVMGRRAAMFGAEGRSLLDALEDLPVDRLGMEEDSCSVCSSSVVVQGISDVEVSGGKMVEVVGGGGRGGRVSWIGCLLAVVVVVIAFAVVVMGVLNVGDDCGYRRDEDHLVPT